MDRYIITTDNTADLPEEYIEKNQLQLMSLAYILDGVTYGRSVLFPAKNFMKRCGAALCPPHPR